ncbi:response regulator [Desulfobacterales bacterium HSG17]|nr:response regulator [Desulfobacterales bacterium HSG17]
MAQKKILIIDDQSDYRFTMGVYLERNGFIVFEAEDGKVGWEKIKEVDPDLVLLDIMMESTFSGFEVCRQVRSNKDFKKLPIIGISGMGDELGVKYDESSDQEYFSPDIFIEKPVDKDLLLEKIKGLLNVSA